MTTEDKAKDLAGGLPQYMPGYPGSGNYNLLEPIAERLQLQEDIYESVEDATKVQTAIAPTTLRVQSGDTYTIPEGTTEFYGLVVVEGTLVIDGHLKTRHMDNNGTVKVNGTLTVDDQIGSPTLEELGKLVGLPRNNQESAAHYQARLIVEFSLLTGEGTIKDLLLTASTLLVADVTSFEYEEPVGSEHGTASLSLPSQAINNTPLTATEIINVLDRLIPASYRLEGQQIGTFTYITPAEYNDGAFDSTKAYDGLDANGDPEDTGGTYAGLI